MRVIVIELMIYLYWSPMAFATNPAVSNNVQIEKENNSLSFQEVKTSESRWKEGAIDVLEGMLREVINTPPKRSAKIWSNLQQDTMYWIRHEVRYLSRHINETRVCAQNILSHIKELNDTASESLWESAAKSAGEARQLAEEAASFTKDIVDNLSQETKDKAVATIASHIKAQIGSNNWRSSQFHKSQKTTGAVLMKASKDSSAELSNLKSDLRKFRLEANKKVDAVRETAEVYVNQSIKYLHIAESYSSFSEEIKSLYSPYKIALFAKDEAIAFAQHALQVSLIDVQKMFDSFQGVKKKPKLFEKTIQGALNKTKSAHEETIKSWAKTNHDAMGISRTFFKFTEVQSVFEKTKSAIYRARVDIEYARRSNKCKAIEENLEKMSESVEKVIKAGSDLATDTWQQISGNRRQSNIESVEQSVYAIWAQFYGHRVRIRVLRLKDYFCVRKKMRFRKPRFFQEKST